MKAQENYHPVWDSTIIKLFKAYRQTTSAIF